MNNNHPPTYSIREMTLADIPSVVAFYNELAAAEDLVGTTTIEDYSLQFHEATARYSTRLLAHIHNKDGSEAKLIGYSLIVKGDSDVSAWTLLHVLPAYRNFGVGNAIIERLEQHARAKGAVKMIVETDAKASLRVSFLLHRGWYIDHAILTMQLDTAKAQPPVQVPSGYVLRNFVAGQDEAALLQVALTAFADFADFYPSDAEHEVERTKASYFDPASTFFACVGDERGAIVGFCTTSVDEDKQAGWIQNMGVVADHRRSGLGRALLLSGIDYLRPHVPLILLGAEDYNTKAVSLYQSVGFTVKEKGIALFKDLG